MKITMKHITTLVLAATTFALVGCTTPTRYGRSTGEAIDDRTITGKVRGALNRDSLTDGTQIQVQTFRGNVHLTGFVDHPVQKERASQVASRVEGVQFFKNDIVVKNQLPSMRAQGAMSEPSGAQSQQFRTQQYGTRQQQQFGQGSAGWQQGQNHGFSDPSGAEAEINIQRNGTNRSTEIEVDRD